MIAYSPRSFMHVDIQKLISLHLCHKVTAISSDSEEKPL